MKRKLGPVNALYPSLTTIVGTLVDGKPNWIAIAHVGILNHSSPQLLSIGVGKSHYSNKGIFENKTFSINIPSTDMLVVTDYVGIVSGKNTDKSELFETFYGELKTAPMIAECPISMELRLNQVTDTPRMTYSSARSSRPMQTRRSLKTEKSTMARFRPCSSTFNASNTGPWVKR